ncbi:hypothetical protein [Paenibacillus thalictri]|uniref:Zf-HC2 domain-containing protein n=1 Tax=Paenibacillus thalictri TaxID=2527873 RepID=A0A4Q9DJ61_9BACL|nr:hypothetical protein [Paenibacillus thalictri]TBL72931.1 hypothetical protein EYB31_27245 [Paenibacillus thalictri]
MSRHYSMEQWIEYVQGIGSAAERDLMESHLYGCDECLSLYMNCLDEHPLPMDTEQTQEREYKHLDQQVMQTIRSLPTFEIPSGVSEASKLSTPGPRRRRLIHHPAFHYAIAAAITLLLMSTGIFEQFVAETGRIDAAAGSIAIQERSVSDKLMEKTLQVLDTLHNKEKGGTRP